MLLCLLRYRRGVVVVVQLTSRFERRNDDTVREGVHTDNVRVFFYYCIFILGFVRLAWLIRSQEHRVVLRVFCVSRGGLVGWIPWRQQATRRWPRWARLVRAPAPEQAPVRSRSVRSVSRSRSGMLWLFGHGVSVPFSMVGCWFSLTEHCQRTIGDYVVFGNRVLMNTVTDEHIPQIFKKSFTVWIALLCHVPCLIPLRGTTDYNICCYVANFWCSISLEMCLAVG